MNPFRLFLALIAAAAVTAAGAAAPADPHAAVRATFRAALLAAEQGRSVPAAAALQRYPLYPYLVSAQLRYALAAGAADRDDEIAGFLHEQGDTPAARPLRRDWYDSLGRRAAWTRLLAEIPADTREPGWRCLRYSALLQTAPATPGLRDDILRTWLTGESLPQSCVGPFDWLHSNSALTERLLLTRARLALDAGNLDLADEQIKGLSDESTAPLKRELRLLRNPLREVPELAAHPDPSMPVGSVYAAWERYIRADPAKAAELIGPLLKAQAIAAPKAGEFIRQLALGLAWDRDPRALEFFRRVPESAQDERSGEWRVRAALWNGQWAQARSWLAQMNPELAAQPRWRYWAARVAEHEGDTQQAAAQYRGLLDANNYYAAAAALRLNQPITPQPQPAPPVDPVAQQRLGTLPALVRAHELYLIERDELARAEWNYALADASGATRIQAAHLAQRWGWYVQSIGALAQAKTFDVFSMTHPRPYDAAVQAAAEKASLPPAWIYAVLRQESLYDMHAVSRRDARGLMQLLPGTARNAARRWQLRAPGDSDLFAPDINLLIGSAELREQFDRFDGSLALALCAYNAGTSRPRDWLPPAAMDADVWIENIPFNETRGYVQKIFWNVVVFGWELNGQGQDVSRLFLPIGRAAP